ncbi:hypothetical protein ABZ915_08930 [Streptomyces sp. NPDC046915]|uniref:hypothetical protein n=1 Tax=Streptomyces sp. NPDC046915 TaxID=3155257 RepID=UPI0033C4F618
MRNRLLRSVVAAALAALVALGVASGVSGAKGDTLAVTEWPTVAVDAGAAGGTGS